MKTSSGGQKKSTSATLYDIVIPILVSLVGALIVLFPSNPINMTLPSRDSGVFLYMGWRMTEGDAPYRDVWDHKPPLIYFVDALGLALTPDSLWGVWLLQYVFIFFTIFIIYKLLAREFGIAPALAGSVILISGLFTVLLKGNVTEGYALVFQAMCFWLFVHAWKKDFPTRTTFWVGVLGGLAFYFKQTTIGIWMAYAVCLLVIRHLQRQATLRDLLALLAGGLLPTLLLVLYLTGQNALPDFWEQAFLYNYSYINRHEEIRHLVPVFLKGFASLRYGWVIYLAGLGWLAGAGYMWAKRKTLFEESHPLVWIALINLPIESFFITVSGRSILHYYLTPLPVMAILSATLILTVPVLLQQVTKFPHQLIHKWTSVVILAVVLLGQVGQVRRYPEQVLSLQDNDYTPVIEYVIQNTRKGDQILLIGAESVLNFLTRREAPTRYVYQYPLALLGRRPMFEEYFDQILTNKPVLIIDTRGRPQLENGLYVPLQRRSEIVRNGVAYLAANYEQVAQFGEWFVYRFKGG
jgi:4-amino-4-deoxy-L-arabinose transferase-like glycosyltransferase